MYGIFRPVVFNGTSLSSLQQLRFASNIKAVKERMKRVESIGKITSAMKMVAAAKVKGDKARYEVSQEFVKGTQNLLNRLNLGHSNQRHIVVISSDKGLCGGANSSIAKRMLKINSDSNENGQDISVTVIGSKGYSQLRRSLGSKIETYFTGTQVLPLTFTMASAIAESILKADPESVELLYNKYKSPIAFETTLSSCPTHKQVNNMSSADLSQAIDAYEFEPSRVESFQDFLEFSFATKLYDSMLNSSLAEQSTRLSAMENASRNAGDMFSSLQLLYNRARQAAITTELCEIISGASAV